jgi:hypothetical protein
VSLLAQAGLIDEFQIVVNPIETFRCARSTG